MVDINKLYSGVNLDKNDIINVLDHMNQNNEISFDKIQHDCQIEPERMMEYIALLTETNVIRNTENGLALSISKESLEECIDTLSDRARHEACGLRGAKWRTVPVSFSDEKRLKLRELCELDKEKAFKYRAELIRKYSPRRPTIQEKQLGCLYGGVAGDALGYAVEFMSIEEIRAKYGEKGIQYYELIDGEAQFSDDTQMMLFTMEGIYMWDEQKKIGWENRKSLKNCLYWAYRDWRYTQMSDCEQKRRHRVRTKLYTMPGMHRRMGPGFTCMRALYRKQPGSIDNPINDSKGNGGLMRVAPIGWGFPHESISLDTTMRFGAESAALTHGHPLGYVSAAMMAGLIKQCVYEEIESLKKVVEFVLEKTMEMFRRNQETAELCSLICAAIALSENEEDDIANIAMLGHSECAESTLAIAIYCVLKYENDFDKTITTAVNFDGDSDTVGAVAGNLFGAWKGIKAIDRKWRAPLHLEKYLDALDDYYS